jgi:hypothetical protein
MTLNISSIVAKTGRTKPRVLVISSINGKWRAADHAQWGATMNGVEAWVYAFDGDYCGYKQATADDLTQYDIVIANSNLSLLPDFVRLAELRQPHTCWVMLIEGGASDYILRNPMIQQALAVSDVVNCINRYALPLLRELARQAGSRARVEYIGIPYPVEGVRRYAIPLEQRLEHHVSAEQAFGKHSIMLCPFLLTRSNDYAVAYALGEYSPVVNYYGYERRLSRKWANWREFWRERSLNPNVLVERARRLYNDPRLTVRSAGVLEDFFPHNADAFLWLNLDPRFTWARYVLDAAALGIPIITTASTGHGKILFPDTTLQTEYDIDGAVAIGKRLLEDVDFYRHVVEHAAQGIEAYSAKSLAARLLAVIGE